MADATYQPKVYIQQGAERGVVASGGSFDVESGGEIDIESGGSLKIAGVAVTASAAELNSLAAITGYPVEAHEVTFTETAGAGTYTGAVAVPAGATILDIIVNGVALWTNAGTATMIVGDTDDDGYFTGIDLKATDLLAGESLSFALAGGKAGAYIANSQVSPRYSASARTINGIITTSSTGGGAGRTRMVVVFALPTASAATKA
jgi:hypothetical protein